MQNSGNLNYRQIREMMKRIEEGMEVVDGEGKRIGKVEEIFMGSASDDLGLTANTPSDKTNDRENSIFEDVAEAFISRDIPKEVHERLLMHGYLKINPAGPLGSDRYAASEQIDQISGNQVRLKARFDDLIKPE